MEMLLKLITVFVLGAVSLWAAIPVGFALQLDPLVIAITSAIGAMLGVIIVLKLGEFVRSRLLTRYSDWIAERRGGRIFNIWDRYGVAGLGLLAPLLVGALLGTVIGIVLGAPNARLLFWMSLGIILTSAVSTFAIVMGIVGIEAVWSW